MTRSATSSTINQIRHTARILFAPGQVVEVRIPGHPQKNVTTGGYFDDHEKLASAAARYDGRANIYATINRIDPALLARANNRIIQGIAQTTADDQVTRRLWLPIDFDPIRPWGISSTDTEHAAALDRAAECRAYLTSLGWPDPIQADSGNGAHLLYAIDLANNQGAKDLVEGCLSALSFLFTDDKVTVDTSVFNASRIRRVYGTHATKGDPGVVWNRLTVQVTETIKGEKLKEVSFLVREDPFTNPGTGWRNLRDEMLFCLNALKHPEGPFRVDYALRGGWFFWAVPLAGGTGDAAADLQHGLQGPDRPEGDPGRGAGGGGGPGRQGEVPAGVDRARLRRPR
jgi:hypothetical protein